MRTAEIIAVGSELLLGGRTETNSVFLAGLLAEQGIQVRWKTVVGDSLDDVGDAVAKAAARAKIVFVTGGLGPTVDDVTREAVARVTRKPLRLCPQAWRVIKTRMKLAGRAVSDNQRRQAFLPEGAQLLRNSVGTAPGFFLKWKRAGVFCLPGVSHEARTTFSESGLPILRRERLLGARAEFRTIHTFGLAEAEVDRRMRGIIPPDDPIRLGLLASALGVSVSLTWVPRKEPRNRATSEGVAARSHASLDDLGKKVDTIVSVLGDHVFATNGRGMEEVVGQSLQAQGFTVALAESCTGGLIGHRLTEVAGSSAYVDRGVTCYSNQSKIELLGVPSSVLKQYGAVSGPVAKAMAEGIRSGSGVDVGLSVTGIAGPGGGTRSKPVGLVYVGLSVPRQSLTKAFRFHGDRKTVKLRASQAALDVLRRWLDNLPVEDLPVPRQADGRTGK